jgi:exoribonuclease R
MDIEMTVDALDLSPHFDHFFLFSGDGDFTALVTALQKRGKKVTVASTMSTSTPMIADELRRRADLFLEEQHALVGERTRRRFRIGDRVRVAVARVDLDERRLDFALVSETTRAGRRPRRGRR